MGKDRIRVGKPFIVVRADPDTGKLTASKHPIMHDNLPAALVEANRLHQKHDIKFVVFGCVGATKKPKEEIIRLAEKKRLKREDKRFKYAMSDVTESNVLSGLTPTYGEFVDSSERHG